MLLCVDSDITCMLSDTELQNTLLIGHHTERRETSVIRLGTCGLTPTPLPHSVVAFSKTPVRRNSLPPNLFPQGVHLGRKSVNFQYQELHCFKPFHLSSNTPQLFFKSVLCSGVQSWIIQLALCICRLHICGFSQLGEKISRKFQKAKLEFSACCNYLYNIHIILGIINNLEMV